MGVQILLRTPMFHSLPVKPNRLSFTVCYGVTGLFNGTTPFGQCEHSVFVNPYSLSGNPFCILPPLSSTTYHCTTFCLYKKV